jgi:beta-lactamase class A
VRDLATGREIGIDPDVAYPIASLVKVPLAVAVLDRIHAGRSTEPRDRRAAGTQRGLDR